ncbi:peptidyl-prolyl cis-trans isomerase [Kingella oralis]|uniref:peptidyl-prolyl cis-trans isomerase n=1 Tax=Kingella oralis TaxID=505 RepID=UPI003C6F3BF9
MKPTYIAAALSAALISGSLFAQTVATVNGTKIDSSELDRRVQAVVAGSQGQVQDSPELRQFIAQQTVVETVVTQAAKKQGLDKSKEYKDAESESMKQAKAEGADKQADFKQQWTDYQNQLLMQIYARDVINKNPVTDAQVQQRYNEIKQRYDNTDEVQIGEIITDNAEQIKAAERDLKAKKSFAEVARKYSIDPNIKAGGTVFSDYISLRDLQEARPNIYQAIGSLKKGQYSKPISGEKLHAIYYINDKRKISVEPLDKIKEGLRASLANERVQEAVGNLMQSASIVPAQ